MKRLIIYLTLCFLVGTVPLLAQEGNTSNVEIIGSRYGTLVKTDSGVARKLWGNVEVKIDSTHFFSELLYIYPDEDIYAEKNIVIKQGDSLYIYADTLNHDAAAQLAILTGKVVLNDRGRHFFTTELNYHLDTKIAEYDTFGLLTDNEAQLTSYYGTYNANTDYAFFRDSVTLVHPDVVMKTDSLRYDARRNIAYFLGPTIIKQKDALIYCEGGYYNLEKKIAFLKYNVQYKEGDKIITADSMKYSGALNTFTLLGDNAHYKTPTVEADAHVMVYNDSTKLASLFHEVLILTEDDVIKGDTIYYNTETETHRSSGGTHIVSGSRIVDAGSTYYNDSTHSTVLIGNVTVRDTAEGYGILGEKIITHDSTGLLKTSGGRPLAYFLSEDKKDTIFLSSDKLISTVIYSDSSRADTGRLVKAFYDVKILGRDYQAVCDSLVYNSLDSVIKMYYSPVLWIDTLQMKGDTVTIHLKQGGISDFFIREHAIIIQHEIAELFNQISGKKLYGKFKDNELRYIDITSNVQSIYYIKDDNNAYSGVAEVFSSSLRMIFKDGEMDDIKYYTQPNGTIHPMTINHMNMRLPAFEWLIDKRPTSLNDLNPGYRENLEFQLVKGDE